MAKKKRENKTLGFIYDLDKIASDIYQYHFLEGNPTKPDGSFDFEGVEKQRDIFIAQFSPLMLYCLDVLAHRFKKRWEEQHQ